MKLPRDVSGGEVARRWAAFGDSVTRQTGSHLRLTTQQHGEHHLAVPQHRELRVGTLAAILGAVEEHFDTTREEAAQRLFGTG